MTTNMTISQALREAAKLRGQVKQHLQNAAASVTWQTGPVERLPAFTYETEVKAADAVIKRLLAVETAVRVANAKVTVEWDSRAVTLTEATAILRERKARIVWLQGLAVRAQETTSEMATVHDEEDYTKRHTVTNTFRCAMPQAKVVQAIYEEQEAFDSLNNLVEQANWTNKVQVDD